MPTELLRTAPGDRYFDYCLEPYRPRRPTTGKLRAENLLWAALAHAGIEDAARPVIEALRTEGVTVIFVEHDMDIVTRYSDRVLAFYDGRIIADDAPDEVLSDPDVQRYVTGGAA